MVLNAKEILVKNKWEIMIMVAVLLGIYFGLRYFADTYLVEAQNWKQMEANVAFAILLPIAIFAAWKIFPLPGCVGILILMSIIISVLYFSIEGFTYSEHTQDAEIETPIVNTDESGTIGHFMEKMNDPNNTEIDETEGSIGFPLTIIKKTATTFVAKAGQLEFVGHSIDGGKNYNGKWQDPDGSWGEWELEFITPITAHGWTNEYGKGPQAYFVLTKK